MAASTSGKEGPFTGNDLADFVGGFFDNYFQFSNAAYEIRHALTLLSGQDAWKVTRNLTFSYGLRYEYNSPGRPHNEIIGWFPGQQSKRFRQPRPIFCILGPQERPTAR